MELTCPKCSHPLPEVETIDYRFCPHCGAEITAEPQHLDDAYLTIPPEPLPAQADNPPMDLGPQTDKKVTVTRQFNDHTSEPQPPTSRQQPKLKPPDTPPPASFFRTRSAEKTPAIQTEETEEKTSPRKEVKKQSPTKKRTIIIVVLVILALIILLLGGLFTF
jgi:hypothetical protein